DQPIDLVGSIFPDGHEALRFDGSGGYVRLPSFTLGGALTLEARVKSDDVQANYARVFDFYDGSGLNRLSVYWYGTSGQMGFGLDASYWHEIISTAVFPQGRWVHVAATVDESGMGALYWDGQVVASGWLGGVAAASHPHPY